MATDVLHALITTTLAMSAAIVVVRLARKPIRSIAGVQVAYGLWIVVPTVAAAALLPLPPMLGPITTIIPAQLSSSAAIQTGEFLSNWTWLVRVILTVWATVACLLCFLIAARQRSFLRSLEPMMRDNDGIYRSSGATVPMTIGAWYPKVVLPSDFESRYSSAERELIVAHERAHASRHDIATNMIASMIVCLYWFNPLMYLALRWLRSDQELACDALVLARRADARSNYANALLKAQLAEESLSLRYPIRCFWHSVHPLKERISMLKHPLPSRLRRFAGVASVLAITGFASYAAWAGQSTQDTRAILVNLKVTVSNPQTNEVRALATQYLVHSGEIIKDAKNQPLDFACTPYLSDESGHSTDWSDQKTRGIPLPAAGQILLDCAIRRDGQVVDRPAVIIGDGKSGLIETRERGGPHLYKMELTATTSPETIASAKKQANAN